MRADGMATTWPTAELESTAKALAAIAGLLAGAWALLARWARRRRAARERRDLEGKAIRYLLDAMRHSLHVWTPAGHDDARLIDVDELLRQKLLIDAIRDQLWIADGNESARVTEQVAADIVKVITRTQAIRAKRERQAPVETDNPFTDGWTPGSGAKP